MKHILLVLIILLFFSLTFNAQNLCFEKVPEWVKPNENPMDTTISKYDISSGYYFTLTDYQVNLDDYAIYNHTVINVISYSGITNASQLSITYDTSYQQLKIHHLYIWRKGKKMDRTGSLSFEALNNEYNLTIGIFSGKITAYDILDDIRKDDLIDFAYTLVGDNPIFENERYLFIPLESMNFTGLCSIRILYSKDKEYLYHCADSCTFDFSDSIIDPYKVIEMNIRNCKPIKYEDLIPSWVIPFKYFILSSMNSWKDVNVWAQKVFALEKQPEFDNVFQEIFLGEETQEDKINKIIDFVQDDIRYMGIETGIGSIKPIQPEQVVHQRYGDCKDKSLLLVSLLKKIGIEKAYPVLVNSDMQHELDQLIPSNQVFNHCIVKFEFNDSSYWVDPSISQQGGDFRELYNFDYGKVLVIGNSSDSLENMSPKRSANGVDITEEMTIGSFTEPAALRIISNRYGFEAESKRALLELISADDISEMVTEELKLLYPAVRKTENLRITDNMDQNHLSIIYNYEIDGLWHDDESEGEDAQGYRLFRYEPQTIYHYLNKSSCEERKYDLALEYPVNLTYRITFSFPGDLLIYDDYRKYENEAFIFEEKIEQLSSNSIQIDYRFITKTSFIKANAYKEICEQKNSIVKGLPIVIYFPK